MARSHCPYCGRVLGRNVMSRHTRVCVKNPASTGRVLRVLHKMSSCGVAPRRAEYERAVAYSFGLLPTARYLVKVFGSWRNVSLWAGLYYYTDLGSGEPEAVRLVQDLATRFHGGLVGPTAGEYDVYRVAPMPWSMTLVRRYGTWGRFLARCGYSEGTRLYYRRAMRQREARRFQTVC